MTAALLSEWSRLLLGSFARAGVEHVVLSPGSRSTPFAWAALKEPKLICHALWDERVAAFFALGQARLTGKPSLLVCTSGSAAAHYYPALIEASLARVPLLVLSADRPFELQHSAAPQTIDQIKLFGDSARAFFEFGAPDPAPSALAGVVRHVAHALHRAQFPDPGPVQLNLRARKPLEPSASLDADSLALHQAVDDLLARGPTRVENPTVHADVTRLADACRDATRGLIVVGPRAACAPEAARALLRLSEVTSFPLLCESASQLRFAPELTRKAARIDGFEWILSHERQRERLRPELVLSFGAPPVSGAYERFLAGFSGARFVVARHGFADPHGIANELICADDADVADRVCAELERRTPSHGARAQFTLDWLAANADAWRAVDDELRRETAVLSEPLAVRTVLEHLPDPCTLVLGNSLPIREVDAYAPCASRRVRVLSQRGANGIDGLISGAAGAASLSHEPVLLLLGDVSFMHDLGGLAAARESRAPLIIVVIDNGGGRIFEQLPFAAEFEKDPQLGQFWLTPPHADFAHAAAVFGHQYERLSTVSEIAPALRDAKVRRGASVLHLVVDGSSARAAGARIRAALSQTWG